MHPLLVAQRLELLLPAGRRRPRPHDERLLLLVLHAVRLQRPAAPPPTVVPRRPEHVVPPLTLTAVPIPIQITVLLAAMHGITVTSPVRVSVPQRLPVVATLLEPAAGLVELPGRVQTVPAHAVRPR